MIPIARRIARAGGGELAVFRLLNSHRGWDNTHTPVYDVRWALEQIRRVFRQKVPVCLVGHSLGGRAALLAAGEPSVAGAVGLAPWVLSSDDPPGVEGKPLLIVHGKDDRVASPARAAALAARLEQKTQVSLVLVDGAGHAMLRHHAEFSRRRQNSPRPRFLRAAAADVSNRTNPHRPLPGRLTVIHDTHNVTPRRSSERSSTCQRSR